MKSWTLLISFLLASNVALAQTALTCEQCKNSQNTNSESYYPYHFCNPATNKIEVVCVKDPYNRPSPYENYKPMKLCLPLVYGEDVLYDNTGVPRANLGPWTEQIWPTTPNQFANVEFRDADMPDLIKASIKYWTQVCDTYNNDDCQDCPIKIVWVKDALKMGSDKEFPAKSVIELKSGCQYDCDKFAIYLNGTSSYTQFNGSGKPSRYFFTRGMNLNIGYSAKLVQNSDMRTEMTHRIGLMLGFAESENSICFTPHTMTATGKYSRYPYLEKQENRFTALAPGSNLEPPYDFKIRSTGYPTRDYCLFKLLYCCPTTTSVHESGDSVHELRVAPNPTNGTLEIEYEGLQDCRVNVVDMFGAKITDVKVSFLSRNRATVDLSIVASGQYVIQVDNGKDLVNSVVQLMR